MLLTLKKTPPKLFNVFTLKKETLLYSLNVLYQINITIDIDAHRVNASQKLVIKEIFGEIEYFITNEYNGISRIFAYVRKVNKYNEDDYGQIYFNKFNGFQFIEVIGIDRCVGFFKIDNLFYILDREKI